MAQAAGGNGVGNGHDSTALLQGATQQFCVSLVIRLHVAFAQSLAQTINVMRLQVM